MLLFYFAGLVRQSRVRKTNIIDCWSFETSENLDNCIEKRKKAKVVQSLKRHLKIKKAQLLIFEPNKSIRVTQVAKRDE